jgi:hypothetical protein
MFFRTELIFIRFVRQTDMFGNLCEGCTTSMQSVPIITNAVSSNPTHGKVYLIHYMIKFVSDLQLSLVSSTNKTDILLKVVLNTITLYRVERPCYLKVNLQTSSIYSELSSSSSCNCFLNL